MSDQDKPIGVVLTDLGGPETLDDVKPYLERFLASPAILPLPGPVRRPLAHLIARSRAPKAAAKYAAVGGGSPIHHETAVQVEALQAELGPSFSVRHAFLFTRPEADDVLRDLAQAGVRGVVILPTFPQASATTTTPCIAHIARCADAIELPWRAVPSFPTGELFLSCLADQTLRAAEGTDALLLVAHGLPVSHVERGDPYLGEVEATAAAFGARLTALGLTWSLAFQSRLGPVEWVRPYLEDEIARLAGEGVRALTVVPIAFGCENLETRYDLDIEAPRLARDQGITRYRRVPAPGRHPDFIAQLALLARDAAAAQGWLELEEDDS